MPGAAVTAGVSSVFGEGDLDIFVGHVGGDADRDVRMARSDRHVGILDRDGVKPAGFQLDRLRILLAVGGDDQIHVPGGEVSGTAGVAARKVERAGTVRNAGGVGGVLRLEIVRIVDFHTGIGLRTLQCDVLRPPGHDRQQLGRAVDRRVESRCGERLRIGADGIVSRFERQARRCVGAEGRNLVYYGFILRDFERKGAQVGSRFGVAGLCRDQVDPVVHLQADVQRAVAPRLVAVFAATRSQ